MSTALIAQGPVDVNVRGWRPIETAPKSPDWFIGLFADGDIRKCVGDTRHWFDWNGFVTDAPTHWMPLPDATNAELQS